ncbi:MAG: amino acid adenylation domain-containing protein, partial [bacterium]|nr:amino acid adenylation domain-containing protein [bacterium]
KPKGVMIEHRSVVNILTAMQRQYPLNKFETFVLKMSYVFDVSVAELFGWFRGGGRFVLLERGGEKDPLKIVDAIENAQITHINFVPSVFNIFVDQLNHRNVKKLSTLKYILLCGEAVLPGSVEKFRQLNTGTVLENIYGPTEATVYSSNYSLSQWDGDGPIPIGKPMQNIIHYILGKGNQLQPIGVPGELSIGGTGVARGYINRPELTAEKFLLFEPQRTQRVQRTDIFFKDPPFSPFSSPSALSRIYAV